MSVTTINRTEQIRAGSANTWVTNDASGLLHDTSVTANRAVASDSNGLPVASVTTATELGYVSGVTSSIQTQLNALAYGLSWKQPVLAATTGTLATSFPGGYSVSGGSTILTETTPTDGSITPLDGVTLTVGSRILIKDETSTDEPNNGIYTVTTLGDGVTTAWVLTRSLDMDTWAQVPAAATFVEEGTVNADKAYVCTSDPGGTLGSTNISFAQFGAISSYVAGSGLTLTGNSFSVNTDGTTTHIVSNNVAVVTGNLTDAGTDGITITGGTGVLVGSSGASISQHVADTTHNGYLSSTDWNTFNGKLSTALTSAHIFVGNGSNVATDTAMTGDVSITNTGVTSISSGLATHFVTREVPSGSINSSNTTFTLANTPVSGTECVYLNGVLQESGAGNDYTISGATITYLAAPQTGDRLLVNYQK